MSEEVCDLDVVRLTRHTFGYGNTRYGPNDPTPVYPGTLGVVVLRYFDTDHYCVEVSCVDHYSSVLADVPVDEVEVVGKCRCNERSADE